MNSVRITTGKVRLSYANIWAPKSFDGQPEKYSCSLIIKKSDTKTVNRIREAIKTLLADKDVRGIVDLLAGAFPRVAVTQTSSPRALPAAELARIFRDAGAEVTQTYPTVEAATSALCGESYVACGSITLAGELAAHFL